MDDVAIGKARLGCFLSKYLGQFTEGLKGIFLMKMRILVGVILLGAAGIVMSRQGGWHVEPPPAWTKQIRTKGQYFPIPEAWVSTPEGKIAHDLVLPDAVPKPVAFDFEKAYGPWYARKSKWEVANAYFKHLCSTEAGEWVFEKPNNVEGIYFARPRKAPTERFLSDVYGAEAPAVERSFLWMGNGLVQHGGAFIRPPFSNFKFIEEPWWDVEWAEKIYDPYIRIFGYSTIAVRDSRSPVEHYEEISPMQARGIDSASAEYAYSWRGIVRPRDREFQIAGDEVIIYHRESMKIVAVSRSFLLTKSVRDRGLTASWHFSPSCRQGRLHDELYFVDFPSDVFSVGRKK